MQYFEDSEADYIDWVFCFIKNASLFYASSFDRKTLVYFKAQGIPESINFSSLRLYSFNLLSGSLVYLLCG